MRQFQRTGLTLALLLLVGATQHAARAVVLHPGDIVIVADISPLLPGGHNYGLVRIDPATGDRTIISDQLIGGGAPMPAPDAIAIAPDGSLLVADLLEGIERVDPATGDRTLIKPSLLPMGVHQVGNEIYYTLGGFLRGFDATTLQTNFTLSGSGPQLSHGNAQPSGFAVIGNNAYVASMHTQFDAVASDGIVRVDLTTGNRTLISGFSFAPNLTAGSGPTWTAPTDVAVDPAGQLLVTSIVGEGVMRIDPVTGARTLVTSNSVGTGPHFPARQQNGQDYRLAVAADGTILLNEWDAGGVWAVDPITGDRTIVSDATHGAGPLFRSDAGGGGILVVPAPEPATFVLAALAGLAVVAARLKRARTH
jgi:hypothetical protein